MVMDNSMEKIKKSITDSWSKIAPCWPLKNIIAINPLSGFVDLDFETALTQAAGYFQTKKIPEPMLEVNRQTIKWLQLFFDRGEAKISMPLREQGLLQSVCNLLPFDYAVTINKEGKQLLTLSTNPELLLVQSLKYLNIKEEDQVEFLTLLLTTLPGWAGYTQYFITWGDPVRPNHPHSITHAEYLAFRILLTSLIWPNARDLLTWHRQELQSINKQKLHDSILNEEQKYQKQLFSALTAEKSSAETFVADAQLVFCIDIRSEPLRRKIEKIGNYETLSMAGFFCLPIIIDNKTTGELYASCSPVIQPEFTVTKTETCWNKKYKVLEKIIMMYQSVKYTFATPFALAEIAGPAKGFWTIMRTFFPSMINKMKLSIFSHQDLYNIDAIPLDNHIEYARRAINMLGISHFAPIIIFCGHSGSSKNNSHETALDCGACGARDGLPNAHVLVQILNKPSIKQALNIPESTQFFAAHYNTTTETLSVHDRDADQQQKEIIQTLLSNLPEHKDKQKRSLDWSLLRPEWGIAGNAALIIGPRWLTKKIDLGGRAFLHSYDHEKDTDGSILTNILLGSGMVAHSINSQYLFSTIDNTAFGSGSKTTQNVTGKIGVMQGNASDLMHGLPLESVYKTDHEKYHVSVRLTIMIHANKEQIEKVISKQEKIQKLVKNKWVFIFCIDPKTQEISCLS